MPFIQLFSGKVCSFGSKALKVKEHSLWHTKTVATFIF